MLGYLSAVIICSEKRTVFRERSSTKTVSFEEQIMSKDKYPSIFSQPNWGYCVYYPSVLKIEYPRIFPSFTWGIFAHVTRLDQSRANENIWWIITHHMTLYGYWLFQSFFLSWNRIQWNLTFIFKYTALQSEKKISFVLLEDELGLSQVRAVRFFLHINQLISKASARNNNYLLHPPGTKCTVIGRFSRLHPKVRNALIVGVLPALFNFKEIIFTG